VFSAPLPSPFLSSSFGVPLLLEWKSPRSDFRFHPFPDPPLLSCPFPQEFFLIPFHIFFRELHASETSRAFRSIFNNSSQTSQALSSSGLPPCPQISGCFFVSSMSTPLSFYSSTPIGGFRFLRPPLLSPTFSYRNRPNSCIFPTVLNSNLPPPTPHIFMPLPFRFFSLTGLCSLVYSH